MSVALCVCTRMRPTVLEKSTGDLSSCHASTGASLPPFFASSSGPCCADTSRVPSACHVTKSAPSARPLFPARQ